MKPIVKMIVAAAGVLFFFFQQNANADRYYSRYYYRGYDNFYPYDYYRDSGIRSPYERGRRALNVTASTRYTSPDPLVYYMVPQRMPMMPSIPMTAIYSPYSNYLPYPYSPYPVAPPTIIERIIIQKEPVADNTSSIPKSSKPSAFIPSQPLGDEGSFMRALQEAQRDFRERRYDDAVGAFHQAVGIQPGNPTVQMGQALSLFAVGDYEGAASALRHALTLNPEWNKTPILLVTFYGETNDFNAHLERLERFVKKSPGNIQARLVLAYGYCIVDRLNEAADILAGILESDPTDLEATTLLGNLAVKQQDAK